MATTRFLDFVNGGHISSAYIRNIAAANRL